MAKKRKKNNRKKRNKDIEEVSELVSDETKKSIIIILVIALALLSFLSLLDLAGTFGGWIKSGLGSLLGWGVYLFPILLLSLGYMLLRPEKYEVKPSNYLGLFLLILSAAGTLQFIKDFNEPTEFIVSTGGGYLGYFIYLPLQKLMGSWASLIVLLAILIISLLISFNTTLKTILKNTNILNLIKSKLTKNSEEDDWEEEEEIEDEEEEEEEEEEIEDDWHSAKTELKSNKNQVGEEEEIEDEDKSFSTKKIRTTAAEKISGDIPDGISVTFANGTYKKVSVPLSLLEGKKGKPTSGDIKTNIETIQNTLENFGIPVEMGEVSVGPTVTQFTLKPEQGIKLSRIVSLQNDLAMSLAAHPIRIEAPIPGKSLVGIEVPNQSVAIVKLKDILTSKEFTKANGRLKICLGEDVSGKSWVIDLADMPHMLIAGATGSGKSVCINNVIVSLLYQYTPDQLRLIMVDPKKVELTNYNNIPHLLTPVITEVDKTINSLRWAVKEMDERYKLLNKAKKRNIQSYNASVLTNKLPYIVVIIDELADLMVTAARDVEAAIVRLSQMARAVGIHLVVATQRPSVNVITGLIKANIPARIAFAVASQIDSRTILDSSGAEKLIGKGDLLFTSAEVGKPRRIQGAYLSDEEIERVIDFWQSQSEPDYNENIVEGNTQLKVPGFESSDAGDELFEEAKEVVIKAGKASASLLQRRLRVGYARAARLIDLLEDQGVVGPSEGAKPREILISDSEIMGIPTETTEHYENDYNDEDSEVEDEEENENEYEMDDEAEDEIEDEGNYDEDEEEIEDEDEKK